MNRYDIGRRIEAYREKRKMSTHELAGRINRSQATISRIENGKQGLTFELLSEIAEELRVHPFALLADEPLRTPVRGEAGRVRRLLARIRRMAESAAEGEERGILDAIAALLVAEELRGARDFPLDPDAPPDDVGLFLNRLSYHLVNALRDNEFRGRIFQMAEGTFLQAKNQKIFPSEGN